MTESRVISALVAKRSELAGLIAHHRKEMARLSEKVRTIDATIKLFAPDTAPMISRPSGTKSQTAFSSTVKPTG